MEILSHLQVINKIKRLAIQIIEQNHKETDLYFAGINNNGLHFAKLITKELKKRTNTNCHLLNLRLNPAKPLSQEIEIDIDLKVLKNKVIIIVDDVANSGRTLFFGLKPFHDIIPKKLEIAVLVDRTHKTFPIHADYVGLSLATTTKDNITVNLADSKSYSVTLD